MTDRLREKAAVDARAVRDVADAFGVHAERFDSLYEDRIPSHAH